MAPEHGTAAKLSAGGLISDDSDRMNQQTGGANVPVSVWGTAKHSREAKRADRAKRASKSTTTATTRGQGRCAKSKRQKARSTNRASTGTPPITRVGARTQAATHHHPRTLWPAAAAKSAHRWLPKPRVDWSGRVGSRRQSLVRRHGSQRAPVSAPKKCQESPPRALKRTAARNQRGGGQKEASDARHHGEVAYCSGCPADTPSEAPLNPPRPPPPGLASWLRRAPSWP